MTISSPDLQRALVHVAEVKRLAAEVGMKPKWRENDLDFVKRITGELQGQVALLPKEAAPASGDGEKTQSNGVRLAKKALKIGLFGLLGLPSI